MSGAVVVVDDFDVAETTACLVREIESRGTAVRLLVIPFAADRAESAAALRSSVERLVTRHALPMITVSSLGAMQVVPSAAQLAGDLAALQPTFIVCLAGGDAGALLAAASDAPVYQVWLDGKAQNLTMRAALIPSDSPVRRLIVTRLRREWTAPRIVQQSEAVALRSWADVEQRSLSGRAVALLLRAFGAPDGDDLVASQGAGRGVGTVGAALATIATAASDFVTRPWRRSDAWFLAYRHKSESQDQFRILHGGSERFFADPCAVHHGVDELVFCEEYRYATGRGIISVSYLQPDGTLSAPKPVLQRPFHLAYPFVFEFDGEWWMVPDTTDNRTVELYRAVEFPFRWNLETTLLRDIVAADATLFYDGRWWMFASVGEYGSSAWDELFLFYADDLAGPWRPHKRNPVKTDRHSSRPAGRLFRRGRQLIRPAQVCSRAYGEAVRFCIVGTLTEDEFVEREDEIVPPSLIPGAVGLHTWSESETLQVVDARLPRAWLNSARFQRQLEAARQSIGWEMRER